MFYFVVRYFVSNTSGGEERAGWFALFVFLVSCDCCVALPRDATSLSAVCDCGISWSYSLTILERSGRPTETIKYITRNRSYVT